MSPSPTKDTLFRAPKSKSETKADITNDAARAMIQAEADKREAKTAKLRAARLEMEAKTALEAPAEKPVKKRATKAKAKTPAKTKAPAKKKA